MSSRPTTEIVRPHEGRVSPIADVAPQRPLAALRQNRGGLVAGAVGGLVAGAIVFVSLRQHLLSDFPTHVQFTATGIKSGVFPGNFLFYVLDALFAGFSTDYWWLKLSLVGVLAVATAAKVWLTVGFVAAEDSAAANAGRATRRPMPRWGIAVAALCALAFSLPGQHEYLGQLTPNVWHNSTTMLLMPFAVGLFWTSLLFLRTGETRHLWWSLPLVALNIAAKPSFVLCFIPVFPLACLVRFGRSPPTRRALLLVIAAGALLAVQYLYIYVADPAAGEGGTSGGVALGPFQVWRAYTSQIPRAFVMSYLFPIVALVLGGAAVRRRSGVRYAVALAAVGLLEFIVLKETGVREFDGNFSWQAIVTNYLLFVALVSALVPWLRSERWGPRQALIALAFAAHLWAGVHYLDYWFTTGAFS